MPKTATPRKLSTSSTLDGFLKPSPSPSTSTSSSSNLKRTLPPSTTTLAATKKSKSTSSAITKKKVSTKKRVPLKQDNRNLGTLDLLDTSGSENDELLDKIVNEVSKKDVKGKGRMVLEEEDWMKEENQVIQLEGKGEKDGKSWPDFEPMLVEKTNGESSESVQSKKMVRGGSKDQNAKESGLMTKASDQAKESTTTGTGVGETIELSDDSEDDMQVEGGLTCPMCKMDLETLPIKKRNSHVGTCIDTAPVSSPPDEQPIASTSSSRPASLLQRGLLAPISRLFSRQQPSTSSSSSSKLSPTPALPSSKPLTSALPNAFTALMAGHAESSQWKEADVASKQKGRMPKGEDRKVPFYKWIDGMQVTVDAFRYGKIEGCKGYFLSHAHSDHYQNLSSSWQHGPIYCSLTTANLIKLKLKVEDKWVIPLPLDVTVKVQGIDVTLIDANHCPGSVLFLFEGPHTDPKSPYSKTPSRIFRHLHCGDFRASPAHILHPSMSFPTPSPPSLAPLLPAALRSRTPKKLDSIYLDTTYLSPSYCFPAQELVISACADLVRERVVEGREEALWRADGRDNERKGIKGWLNRGDSGGVKDELKEEEEGVELGALPEESEEGLGGEESMGMEESFGGEGEGEDGEEWRMIREMESVTPREETVEPGYFETGENSGEGDEGLEEVPKDQEEQAEQDREFGKDHHVKSEVKMEEDSKVELKPKIEREDEEERKPDLEGLEVDVKDESDIVKDDLKPDLKPDVKPKNERLLVMVGTYSIGKERIVKAIAHALNTKIYADPRKKELFVAQDDPDLHSLLTDDPLEAQVHVGWLQSIQREAMLEYLAKYKAPRCEGGFTKMIGLRPTGWTYRSESKDKFPSIPKILQLEQSRKFSPAGLYPQRDSTPQCMAFGVPYSEHSSFFELTCFCLSLEYVRIIPTVNVHNVNSRNKMKEWIDRWAAEKKRRNDARMPKVIPYRDGNYW